MKLDRAHFFEFTPESLRVWFEERNLKAFRAKQVVQWVYERRVLDPKEMTNLSTAERSMLSSEMAFISGDVLAHQVATDGTQKLLMQWHDDKVDGVPPREPSDPLRGTLAQSLPVLNSRGTQIDYASGDPKRQTECVMIPSGWSGHQTNGSGRKPDGVEGIDASSTAGRKTACISSQVGCPVGCKFCASGLGGLDGNLTTGRIVEQVYRLGLLPGVGRITNVVFMGMGEPLANFKAVTNAVRTLTAEWGLGIGARRITISTVGLAPAIERLADQLEIPVTLALSLHAPNDALRRDLIPWAEYTSIDALVAACTRWFEKTGREITLEYILLRDVNDRVEHARELAGIVRRLRANVNLIRYNEVKGMPFSRPGTPDVHAFRDELRKHGINVHIRASRGRDIAAACGQLRHETASV